MRTIWSGGLERSVWVGGFSPFSTNDDFLTTLEFELGSSQGFLCMWSSNLYNAQTT